MLADAVKATMAAAGNPLVVSTELGPAGSEGTASAPRVVRVRDRGRDEFVLKCPAWSRDPHPYLCANEWIAGLLAVQCGLPTLTMAVVEHLDCLAVGWGRLPEAMWASLGGDRRILEKATNADVLYEMVVFDALVRNPDRHARNITARRVSAWQASYELFLYDHNRALMPPPVAPDTIHTWPILDEPRLWIRDPAVRSRITSADRLERAVDIVQNACSQSMITSIVDSTPPRWLAPNERQPVAEFLWERSADLAAIVRRKASAVLPELR